MKFGRGKENRQNRGWNDVRYQVPHLNYDNKSHLEMLRVKYAIKYQLNHESDFYTIVTELVQLYIYYKTEIYDVESFINSGLSISSLNRHFLSKHNVLLPRDIKDLKSKMEGQIKMIEDDLSRITQLTGVEYKGKLPINSRLLKIAPEFCQKYMTES